MRRFDKLIGDFSEVEEVLRCALVGRFGVCAGGLPYVVPVCFVYHRGRIYFHSASEGMKLDFIRCNPRVCFEVEEYQLVKASKPCSFEASSPSGSVDS